MTPVVVSPRAIVDVEEIAGGIAVYNPEAAARFYDAVAQTYDLLGRIPRLGTRRAAVDRRFKGLRSTGVIGFRTYLVFFVATASSVRVVHGARDIDGLMGPAI